jgi:hypothetical protein
MGACSQLYALTAQIDELRHPESGLNGDKQKSAVPSSNPSRRVGGCKKSVDFFTGEEFDEFSLVTFAWHGEDSMTEIGVGRLVERHVSKEGMDCSESSIPCPDTVCSLLLDMLEELANEGSIQNLDGQVRRLLAEFLCRKLQEQTKGISVRGYGVRARSALPKKPVGEEGL